MLPRQRWFSARDGLRLAALEWDGPAAGTSGRAPLLCLPGIGRTARDFMGLALRYRRQRRVVALDYAGHGESEFAADPRRYSVPTALSDLQDALAALHLHRPVLLGTSFGGICGMALGVLRPTALSALVLNDTGPRLEPAGLDLVRDFIGRDPAFVHIDDAVALLKQVLPPLGIPERGWRLVAESTYKLGEDGRWHPRWDPRIVQALGPGADGPTELWGLFRALGHLPLLLVRGGESAILSAATAARMREERPDMGFVELPGIGHAPTLLEPPALRALDAFLGGLP